ncbi:MAG: hypothetical protein K8F58_12235 [Bauldia sp.]|nr:hypothetical protein [Bauldia sp.]
MTTLRQVKRLLAPLLERHDDLVLIGRWLFLEPVHHIARGILIERIGEAARFRAWWAVTHLCEPLERLPLNWATGIKPTRDWNWDNPTLQADLFAAIEGQALPPLRTMRTLDDFVAFASSTERFRGTAIVGDPLRKVLVDIARGELEMAHAACAELATGRTTWSRPSLREEFARVIETMYPLLIAGDRPGMARLLHEWEAYTVDKLKLGDIWEKTPFPLECPPASG